MPSQSFRAGVVIVVRHPDRRRVLAFRRSDVAESWQLPQGGLDVGEAPIEAAWRELFEETGLDERHVTARAEYPEWVAYEWPPEVRATRAGKDCRRIGQVQRWFLFDALADDIQPAPDGSEFDGWRWVSATWLTDHVIEWRRGAYRTVLSTL